MVNRMDKMNYIKINTKNMLDNIHYLKDTYPYSYYIVDVSNNAFHHGMYLIKYLDKQIDYLYVNHFHDLLLIRKYHVDLPVIYDGEINEDNIYDLIMNNAILVIHDLSILEKVKCLSIKDPVSFVFYIDPEGFYGIHRKEDILDYLEWDFKYFHLLGVMARLNEKNYDDFKYIIRPLNHLDLMILNQEEDKRKIQGSNAIKLDYSIYGLNVPKKKLFQKQENNLKQIFTLSSKIVLIKKEIQNKKERFVAVIPFGYYHGMNDQINSVWIHHKLYKVLEIFHEFMYVEVDYSIEKGMKVEITSEHNPLENYFRVQPLNYFSLFHSNLSIVYDDYILEVASMY